MLLFFKSELDTGIAKKNHPGYVWNPLEIVKRTSFRAVRERLFCCCFTSATRKKPCHVNHVSIDGQGLHFQLENVWVYILVVIFLVSISLDLNPFCQPLSKDLPLHLLGLCCLLLLAATLRKGQGTRGEKPPKPTWNEPGVKKGVAKVLWLVGFVQLRPVWKVGFFQLKVAESLRKWFKTSLFLFPPKSWSVSRIFCGTGEVLYTRPGAVCLNQPIMSTIAATPAYPISFYHILQRKIHANCNFAHFHFHEKSPFASKVRTFQPSHFCGSPRFGFWGVDRRRWCHWQEHNDWCTSVLFFPMRKMMDIGKIHSLN